jgi:hypothetical protein
MHEPTIQISPRLNGAVTIEILVILCLWGVLVFSLGPLECFFDLPLQISMLHRHLEQIIDLNWILTSIFVASLMGLPVWDVLRDCEFSTSSVKYLSCAPGSLGVASKLARIFAARIGSLSFKHATCGFSIVQPQLMAATTLFSMLSLM